MATISPNEQRIYNDWLRAIAARAGRPYRKRINFDKMSDADCNSLTKLDAFFERNEISDPSDYFLKVLNYFQEKHLPLAFFSGSQAATAYTRENKKLLFRMRTDVEVEQEVAAAFIFIAEYCVKKKIPFSKYISHKEEGSAMPVFLSHVRENKFFPVVLRAWPDFQSIYCDIDDTLLEFVLSPERKEFLDNIEYRCNTNKVQNQIKTNYKELTELLK